MTTLIMHDLPYSTRLSIITWGDRNCHVMCPRNMPLVDCDCNCIIVLCVSQDHDFFQHLEMYMRTEYLSICGRDHLAYRSYYFPLKVHVDIYSYLLICNLFFCSEYTPNPTLCDFVKTAFCTIWSVISVAFTFWLSHTSRLLYVTHLQTPLWPLPSHLIQLRLSFSLVCVNCSTPTWYSYVCLSASCMLTLQIPLSSSVHAP